MKISKTDNGYSINYGMPQETAREALAKHREWLLKCLEEANMILDSGLPERAEQFFKDGEQFGITEMNLNPPQDPAFDNMMQNLWPQN